MDIDCLVQEPIGSESGNENSELEEAEADEGVVAQDQAVNDGPVEVQPQPQHQLEGNQFQEDNNDPIDQ